MKIDLFSIGKFTIHGYGLMIAIGILCCVAMASYRAKKNGLDQEAIVDGFRFRPLFPDRKMFP